MATPPRHAGALAAFLLCLVGGWGGLWLIERQTAARVATVQQDAFDRATSGLAALGQMVEQVADAVTTLHMLGALLDVEDPTPSDSIRQLIADYLVETTANRRFAALQLAIIDAQGTLAWSTVPGFRPIDLSDREHFRVHRDGRVAPFVSEPLLGRASGQWSVQFTRPLRSASGSFRGIVVASLDPADLSAELAAMQRAPGAVATLLRKDGVVLARSEKGHEFIGSRLEPGALRLLASDPGQEQNRAVHVEQSRDGDPSVRALRRVAGWPLAISFEVSQAADLNALERRRTELQIALLVGLGMTFGSGLLIDSRRARHIARREAERSEASRREMFELLEGLPGATYRGVLAEDGTWVRLQVSSAFGRLFPSDASASEDWANIIRDAERLPAERERFTAQILAVGEAVAEYRVQLPAGSVAWVRDQARRIDRSPAGTIEVIGILTDITDELQVKAQAVTASKLATLGEMATGLAHELSQPCASISLSADIALLELGQEDNNVQRRAIGRLEDILRQTTRMREVIDHFRLFSRGELRAGDSFVPDAAVHGALAISRGTLVASGIQISLTIEPDLPPVRGSLVPFEQVLVNLLINARDAMADLPTHAREVHVTARQCLDEEGVVIEVRDTGPGVPEHVLPRVFEPFFSTKAAGEGTGLGLAIAYGTVRSAGGRIEIANHPDGGALVTLTLQMAGHILGDQNDAPA